MADGGSLSAKELRQAHGGINLTANVDLSKVLNLSNTLQRMISNKNLQKYWKNTEDLIQDVSKACNTYKTNLDKISATELIKTVNALTAKSPTFDITEFANQFEDFEDILSTISKIDLGNLGLDEAFSVKSFQETFSTFDLLRSEGLNMMSFFKAMAHDKSVAELERQLEESRLKNIDLNQSLENTKQELNDLSRSTGFSALKDELDDLQGKLYNLTHSAEREFSNFLDANGFDAHFFKNYDPEDDWFYDDDSSIPRVAGRAKEYFDEISAGSMTAKEAIANFRSEFNNLLLSSYRNTDGSFGADQIEVFADYISKIFTQVEEISTKINDIMTNGVMSRGSLPGELPEGYAEGIQDYSSIIQMISDIIKSSEEIGDGSSDLYKSLAEVLSTIERIASIDISNLSEVYSVISAIGKLDDIKIDKTPLENLMNALERLSQFENTSPLISMSAVDFSKFNDLHISKASLANLAEYLPRIADINPNNLIELTKIDFNGLNGLKIDKESMKNLMSFIDGLKTALGTSGTGNPLEGFVEANKGVEKSADDSKSELQAEADLMKSIAENARQAADAKKEFVEANKKVEKSASDSISSLDKENSSFEDILPNDKKFKSVLNSLDLTKSKISEIAKVTRQAYADENGKFIESFVIKGKDGSTETYGASSHTQKGQLLRYNYVEYDTSTEKKAELKLQKKLLQASREAWEINDIINKTNKSFENLEVNPALISDLADVESKLFQLNQEFANGKISLPVYESQVNSIIDLYNEQLEVQKRLVDEANSDWNAVTNTQNRMSGVIKPPDNSTLSKNYNDLYSAVSKLNEELLDENLLLPDYTEQVDELFSEYEKLKKIQQKRDYEEYEIERKLAQDLKVEHDKDIQNEWKKNVAAIQEYLDAQSELNSLKAKDRRTGKYENKILDQEKAVDSLREKAEEARAALSSMIGSSPVPLDDWNKWLDAMEKFRQATVGSTESIANLKDSFKGELTKFQTSFTNQSARKPEEADRTLEYQNALDKFQKAIDKLSAKYKEIKESKGVISSKDVEKWIELTSAVEQAEKAVKSFSPAEKGSSTLSRAKEIDKITKYLDKNTRISSEARLKLNEYLELLNSKNPLINLEKIHTEFLSITAAERVAGREGKNFIDIITDKTTYGIAAQIGQMFSFYDFINYLREGIAVVKDFDTALTEMRKVSDETVGSLKNYQEASFDLAEDIGSTALAIQNSTADFMRLGHELDEASDLSIDATIYANVGDMEIDEATSHMISSIQAWKSEFETVSDASTGIIDRYNEVGNRFAITSADIGSAMSRSAAALKAAGNSLNESIGIITAGNLIQQDADTTANALKILSLRIRGAKSELEAMGETTDDLVGSTSKMRNDLKALTNVDIMLDENTFKSTTQIIQELGEKWESFSDITRANALEMLAGKNRASTISGLIENYEVIEEVIKACEEAEGSAREENEKFLESIQGRINLLSNQATELWTKVIDDETLKTGIDLATQFLKIITELVDNIGILGTLGVGGSAFAGFKNYGLLQLDEGKLGLGDLFKSSKVDTSQYKELIEKFSGLTLNDSFYQASDDGKSILKYGKLKEALNVEELEPHIISYVDSLKNATGEVQNHEASIEGLDNHLKMVGQRFDWATIKANLFNAALNAGISFAIVLIIQGLSKLVDHINVTTEELTSLTDSFKDGQDELKSLEAELETTQQRLSELEKIKSPTLAEQDEIDKLQETNRELETQIVLLKEKQRIAAKELLAETNRAATTRNNYQYSNFQNGKRGYGIYDDTATNTAAESLADYSNRLIEARAELNNLKQAEADAAEEYDKNEKSSSWADYRLGELLTLGEKRAKAEENYDALQSDATEEFERVKAIVEAYEAIYEAGGTLTDEEMGEYVAAKASMDDYINTLKVLEQERKKAFSEKTVEEKRTSIDQRLQMGHVSDSERERILNGISDDELDLVADIHFNSETTLESIRAQLDSAQNFADEDANKIKVPLTVSQSVNQVAQQLKPQFDALKEAYQNIFYTDEGFSHKDVGNDMLENLRAAFQDISDEMKEADLAALPTEEVDKFLDTLADVDATKEDVQQAFNDIATSWLYGTDVLKDLNDETATSIEKMLEEMGVTNAHEVVTWNLAAAKEYAAEKGEDLADASASDIAAFAAEKAEAGLLSEDLAKIYWGKIKANMAQIESKDDIDNLIAIAEAAGATASTLQKLEQIKNSVNGKGTTALQRLQLRQASDEDEALNVGAQVKINYKPPKDDASKAGKEAADAYVEAFEKELKTLETLKDQGKITEKEYLDYLRQLYERYFKDREEYLDKYKEYEDKYLRGKIYAPFYSNVDYKK